VSTPDRELIRATIGPGHHLDDHFAYDVLVGCIFYQPAPSARAFAEHGAIAGQARPGGRWRSESECLNNSQTESRSRMAVASASGGPAGMGHAEYLIILLLVTTTTNLVLLLTTACSHADAAKRPRLDRDPPSLTCVMCTLKVRVLHSESDSHPPPNPIRAIPAHQLSHSNSELMFKVSGVEYP
jgi:hypothetical protein